MLQRMADRLWGIAWSRWGKPTMTVVRPTTLWNLPAGYSLDSATGNVRDGAGVVMADPSAYIASTTVAVVPAAAQHNGTEIMPADITPDDVVVVRVRYSDLAAVRAAQWVEYGGERYDVVDDARSVQTTDSHLAATVTLHRRRDDKRTTWSQWDRRWMGQ